MVLTSAPTALRALARFECRTDLAGTRSVLVSELDDNAEIISLCAAFAVLLFAVFTVPGRLETKMDTVFAGLTGLFATIWTPAVFSVTASPDCPDTALVYSADAADTTLPSGAVAVRSDDTQVDEAARVMAAGIFVMGLGSALLLLSRAWMTSAKGERARGSRTVLLYVPAIYVGGAAAVRYTADLDDEEWSRDPANTVAARAVCTDSSTAPLGDRPADRDTFEDALFAVVVAAAVAVGGYLLQAGLDRCGRLSDRKKAVAVSIIAALVTFTHLVVTLLLCLGVLVGTNPVCAHATLADNRWASWGFAVLGFGCTCLAFCAVALSGTTPSVCSSARARKHSGEGPPVDLEWDYKAFQQDKAKPNPEPPVASSSLIREMPCRDADAEVAAVQPFDSVVTQIQDRRASEEVIINTGARRSSIEYNV
eukprot:m.432090 g.432090  ORF g.432090 m.432090 type:complete len:424 (-) comp17388_c0_seq1:64-1335(-)